MILNPFLSGQQTSIRIVGLILILLFHSLTSWSLTSETQGSAQPGGRFDSSFRQERQKATRFLWQASFGPTPEEVSHVMELGVEGWIDHQFQLSLPRSQMSRTIEIAMMAEPEFQWFEKSVFNRSGKHSVQHYQLSAWWEQALTSPDQLRQRVAYALSQILVVSTAEPPLQRRSEALAVYNDLLLKHAFGNYRELLSAIVYSPAMGIYLSHQGNRKANPKKQTSPDENFARELMQLFSLGLYQISLDGTPVLDTDGKKIPAYSQQDVMELARIFTGWDLVGNKRFGQKAFDVGTYLESMEFTARFHDSGTKRILGDTISENLDGQQEIEAALDILFSQHSVAPYVSRLLIQRLVTSNPSPEYIQRVSLAFGNNGEGVRGDMKAVIKAILLDDEARLAKDSLPYPIARKLKEPIIAFSGLLRFLKVRPAPPWKTKLGGLMHQIYWFSRLNVGQDPLRSHSVFNFYEPDFQPAGDAFSGNQFVAPEAAVLDTVSLAKYSNLVRITLGNSDLQSYKVKGQQFRESMKKQRHKWAFNARVDTLPLLRMFELGLEMDTSGDYSSLSNTTSNSIRQRQHALSKVLESIEDQLLGFPLDTEYKGELLERLIQPVKKNPRQEAHRIISSLMHTLVMSPEYWVMR